ELERGADLGDLRGERVHVRSGGFEFKSELATLPTEGFELLAGCGEFTGEAGVLAVEGGDALVGLRDAVANVGGGVDGLEDLLAALLLLALNVHQVGSGGRSLLLLGL